MGGFASVAGDPSASRCRWMLPEPIRTRRCSAFSISHSIKCMWSVVCLFKDSWRSRAVRSQDQMGKALKFPVKGEFCFISTTLSLSKRLDRSLRGLEVFGLGLKMFKSCDMINVAAMNSLSICYLYRTV